MNSTNTPSHGRLIALSAFFGIACFLGTSYSLLAAAVLFLLGETENAKGFGAIALSLGTLAWVAWIVVTEENDSPTPEERAL